MSQRDMGVRRRVERSDNGEMPLMPDHPSSRRRQGQGLRSSRDHGPEDVDAGTSKHFNAPDILIRIGGSGFEGPSRPVRHQLIFRRVEIKSINRKHAFACFIHQEGPRVVENGFEDSTGSR